MLASLSFWDKPCLKVVYVIAKLRLNWLAINFLLQADERRGTPEAERPTAAGVREDPRIRPRLCTKNQGI